MIAFNVQSSGERTNSRRLISPLCRLPNWPETTAFASRANVPTIHDVDPEEMRNGAAEMQMTP